MGVGLRLSALDRECRTHRALSVILLCLAMAEIGGDLAPSALGDRAAISAERLGGQAAECVDDDAQVLWIVRRVPLDPYKFGGERCDIAPFCRARRGFGRRPRTLGCACRDWRHLALRGGVCIGQLCDLRWSEAQPVEAIALAGHRDYQSRPFRIDLDLASQLPDQHVDAAVERLEPPVGESVQQSVAADNSSWPRDEHPQKSELAARQRDRLARIAGERTGVEVENQPGKAQER